MDKTIAVTGVGRHHARRARKWLAAYNVRAEFHAPGRFQVYVTKYGDGWTANLAAKALEQTKSH